MILNDMSVVASASVLVVGDSRLTATVLSRDLEPRIAVPTVRTAEEALERILLDSSVIAVVCDLTLPGMSGEALLARLRASRSTRLQTLPFVALGGNDDPQRAARIVGAGAGAYVAKPRASRDLARTLAALLDGRFDIRPAGIGSGGSAETETETETGHAATRQGVPGVMPIVSALRLRWQARSLREPADDAPPATVYARIRHAFESELRARDRWHPDLDGRGGALGLTCPLEDALRPLLRLARNLREAAARFDCSVSISMALETARPTGTIDVDDPLCSAASVPALPEAGELTVVLPSAQFRLKLDRVGRS
ncbi:MAG: response regulator [Burkholderiaceae bacterium]